LLQTNGNSMDLPEMADGPPSVTVASASAGSELAYADNEQTSVIVVPVKVHDVPTTLLEQFVTTNGAAPTSGLICFEEGVGIPVTPGARQ
jgi:hypothetical protein